MTAMAAALVGGAVSFYILYVSINGLNLIDDPTWGILITLVPLAIIAMVGMVIIKIF